MDRGSQARPRASRAALLLIFVTFLPLGFSEEFADGVLEAVQPALLITDVDRPPWLQVGLDGVLLLLAFVATCVLWSNNPSFRARFVAWWLAGAAVTLLLDVLREWPLAAMFGGRERVPIVVEVAGSFLYVAAAAVVLGAAFCALSRHPDRDRAEFRDFRSVVPLLVGLLVAYIGASVWGAWLDRAAVRENCGDDGVMVACSGAIEPLFFAQVSQIIPLLLIGVGLDARFFARTIKTPNQRATLIVIVVILGAGEVLAISALPKRNRGSIPDVLPAWHEYFAFVFTLQAVAVGLATLAWALILSTARAGRPAATKVRGVAELREQTQTVIDDLRTLSEGQRRSGRTLSLLSTLAVVHVVVLIAAALRRWRRLLRGTTSR